MNNKPKLPNFLIVGASKSGTTSLWRYLSQHPEIFMPWFKETHYLLLNQVPSANPESPRFSRQSLNIDSFEEYADLYKDVKSEKAVGEATSGYLHNHEIVIPNIHKVLGEVKIIIILRNPADRAFSAYKHLIRDKLETLSFQQCLALEDTRYKDNWEPMHFYRRLGLYYNQVKAFKDNFSEVFIALTDDLNNNQDLLLRDLYEFLGVEPTFKNTDSSFHNTSVVYQNNIFQRWLDDPDFPIKTIFRPLLIKTIGHDRLEDIVNYFKSANLKKMKKSTRTRLIDYFTNDILKLQDLIGRDLSHWLS